MGWVQLVGGGEQRSGHWDYASGSQDSMPTPIPRSNKVSRRSRRKKDRERATGTDGNRQSPMCLGSHKHWRSVNMNRAALFAAGKESWDSVEEGYCTSEEWQE